MWSGWKSTFLGAFIRAWMFRSGFHESLSERVEISTPINAWKRVVEGVYLGQRSQSPYDGDSFHESPISLAFYTQLLRLSPWLIQAAFIIGDVLTAIILTRASSLFFKLMLEEQKKKKKDFHVDSKSIVLTNSSQSSVPNSVTAAYMLNPYSIFSCVAMTTTVWSNLVLSLALLGLANKSRVTATFFVAFASYQGFYPLMMLVPIVLATSTNLSKKELTKSIIFTLSIFAVVIGSLLWISQLLSNGWRFIDSTYGCILKVPDLTPNIGLFWYFFTEMFDHFHLFFTYVFQMNPFVYVLPLALRFSDNVPLLSFTLCAIGAIFKSYPSIGDVAFYLALLPLWNHLVPYFRHSFIVGCILLVTSVLSPILWYLWIYTGSANANFFFATTLAFATAQIFLLTDVLFAQAKYDYHLRHGTELKTADGKEGALVLE